MPNDDDIVVILGDLGREHRELGAAVRHEREPTLGAIRAERDPMTPELRREASDIASAERRLKALEHKAASRSFARQVLGAILRRDLVEIRYLEVRDTTPHWATRARYAYWVTGYDGHHTGLSRDEVLDLLGEIT